MHKYPSVASCPVVGGKKEVRSGLSSLLDYVFLCLPSTLISEKGVQSNSLDLEINFQEVLFNFLEHLLCVGAANSVFAPLFQTTCRVDG